MTAPTRKAALDLAAALAQYRAGLPALSDVELEHRAAAVAALPGWFAGELRQLVDDEREFRLTGRPATTAGAPLARYAVGVAVAGVPAVLAGRVLAQYADVVPEHLVYSPAVALALVAAVVGGRRVAQWVGEHRHPLAVDVDEADLNPLGEQLLARVRAGRVVGGEH